MGWWPVPPVVLIRRKGVRLWRCCGFFFQESGAEHSDAGGSNRCSDQDGQHSNYQHSTRIRLVFLWMDLPCYIQRHGSNSGLYNTVYVVNQMDQSLLENYRLPIELSITLLPWHTKIYLRVQKTSLLVPILSQDIPVRIPIHTHFFKIHFVFFNMNTSFQSGLTPTYFSTEFFLCYIRGRVKWKS